MSIENPCKSQKCVCVCTSIVTTRGEKSLWLSGASGPHDRTSLLNILNDPYLKMQICKKVSVSFRFIVKVGQGIEKNSLYSMKIIVPVDTPTMYRKLMRVCYRVSSVLNCSSVKSSGRHDCTLFSCKKVHREQTHRSLFSPSNDPTNVSYAGCIKTLKLRKPLDEEPLMRNGLQENEFNYRNLRTLSLFILNC